MNDSIHLSGRCLCGEVTYSISAEPAISVHCACDNCRHGTGAEHASFFAVPAEAVTITGALNAYTYSADSGATVVRHFCPTCGSPVYSETSSFPGMQSFAAGTLDDIQHFSPRMFVFHGKAAPFDRAGEGVTTFDAMPPETQPA